MRLIKEIKIISVTFHYLLLLHISFNLKSIVYNYKDFKFQIMYTVININCNVYSLHIIGVVLVNLRSNLNAASCFSIILKRYSIFEFIY